MLSGIPSATRPFLALLALTALLAPRAHALPPRAFTGSVLLGVPHPIDLAGDLRLSPGWSTGIALGSLRPTIRTYTVGISNADLRGRWHPWDGSFFLGLILGAQGLSGESRSSIAVSGQQVPVKISLKVPSGYITPHLGWLWTFKTGFVMGFELGWQAPLGSSAHLDVEIEDPTLNGYLSQVKATPQYQKLQSDLEDGLKRLGQVGFPYVTLLRLGWNFD
jgi:hypothetical protein